MVKIGRPQALQLGQNNGGNIKFQGSEEQNLFKWVNFNENENHFVTKMSIVLKADTDM